jgi:threonine aldolase
MMTHPSFGSDNHVGVHPEILAALLAVNDGHSPSYDTDPHTRACQALFRQHFGSQVHSFLVFNGTGANVTALRAITRSHEAVICALDSHVNLDECAAPEVVGHCKLYPLASKHGKLHPDLIKPLLIRGGDQHYSPPRVISVAQPTELGLVYTREEIHALSAFAKQHGLLLHVDGARFANAAVRLGVSLGELAQGVDVLSLGGTKNGFMFGEAVVFLNPDLAHEFRYVRKQLLQLPSKSRFIAAQFSAYLQQDLWRKIARHVNSMADYLAERLALVPSVEIVYPVESNAVFVRVPKQMIKPLRKEFFFFVWDPAASIIRLMCGFDTTRADIDAFVAQVQRLS